MNGDLLGTYIVLGLLGLLVVGLVVWVVAGEVSEQRKIRAAARFAAHSHHPSRRRGRRWS